MAPSTEPKQHSACDECRRKKLRCSGEQSGCRRCLREGLECVYSAQKPMGRPKKRQQDMALDDSQTSDPSHRGSVSSEAYSVSSPSTTQPHQQPTPSYASSDFNSVEDFYFPPETSSAQTNQPPMPAAWESTYYETPSFDVDTSWQADISHDEPLLRPDTSLYEQLPATTDPNLYAQQNVYSDTPNTGCSCLANMYLAGSMMQNPQLQGFPFVLPPIRSALSTAYNILVCQHCPLEDSCARQNIMLVATMLNMLTAEIHKLLRNIDAEALLAESENRTKSLRMGDIAHNDLHTGTADCPAGFEVELAPAEWKMLAKRVVQGLVSRQSDDGKLSLESLVTQFENRQRAWHSNPLNAMAYIAQPTEPHNGTDATCLRLAKEVRRQITNLPLTA